MHVILRNVKKITLWKVNPENLFLNVICQCFSLVNKVQFNIRLSILYETEFKFLLFSLKMGCSLQIKRKADYIKISSNSVSVLPLWCPNSQFILISIFILEVILRGSHDVFSTWIEYGVWCQECSAEKKNQKDTKTRENKQTNEPKHWASKISSHSGVPLQFDYVITSFLLPEGNAEL